MTDWFWSSPQWARYCAAYPQPVVSNNGPHGNLIVSLDDGMWGRMGKGHRSQIRKTERTTQLIIDTDGTHLDVFQGLHYLDAGRVTRPQATWDVMRDWMPRGLGVVVIAIRDHLPIGGAYFVTYQTGSYYFSAARDPEYSSGGLFEKDSPAHLIVWTAMTWLRERGHTWLDLGPVPPPDASEKEKAIAGFKSHFGAEVVQRVVAA